MTKRFIEFATQNTDNGEINNGFQDIKTGEWYYTKDSENAKKICELLNELNDKNLFLSDFRGFITMEHQKIKEENEQLKKQLFETSKELLWATSDEVDRALHYEDEVEELRKEIFE